MAASVHASHGVCRGTDRMLNSAPRLAVFTDFREEGWPSMDLCGDMLLDHLPQDGPFALGATRLCPPFRRVATRLPLAGRRRVAFNADRLLNRFVLFHRYASRAVRRFDVFHIADHSYAQLVHALPAGRTGVHCHDLDAFRCLFDPVADRRPRWFRAMSRRILTGLRKAAVVFYNSQVVGEEIKRVGLIDPDRLVYAPLGVAPEFTSGTTQPAVELPPLAEVDGRRWVLHVGSCIPRKRIDVLLDVVAAARKTVPELRLVKVGGEWTADQAAQIARLGLAGAITHARGLTRAELAEVYRQAGLVLVPSEAEGFGLPVIEALACGAAVVASDIPPLREAGGPAAVYAPVGEVEAWSSVVVKLLTNPAAAPPRHDRLAWAGRFTWTANAEIIARTCHQLLRD
jgi:glycosyltransferase involved in cell wall biosynthesis